MKLRSFLDRQVWAFARRISIVEYHRGIPIGLFSQAEPPNRLALAKVKRALDLIAAHDPLALRRIERYVPYIQILGSHPHHLGKWHDTAQVCELVRSYLESEETTPLHVAATIIHESVHARLNSCGFDYSEDRRFRIERLCFQAERAFAVRIGGVEGKQLAATVDRYLSLDRSYWSDRAMAGRRVERLVGTGLPQWMARTVVWITKGRAT